MAENADRTGTLWKEELSSLSTLVGTVATLLAVITPSEGVEIRRNSGDTRRKGSHLEWKAY